MKNETVGALPWLVLGASLLAYAAAMWLALSSSVTLEVGSGPGFGMVLAAFLAYAGIGAVVASRRPRNPVGWLLCAIGLVAQVQGLASATVNYAATPSGRDLPRWLVDPWLIAPLLNLWVVSFSAVGLLMFIFPSGKLISRRSIPVLALAAFTVVVGLVTSGFGSGPTALRFPLVEVVASDDAVASLYGAGRAMSGVSLMLLLAVGAISMVVRLRRASGVERQQMKWFAYAAVVLALVFVGTAVAFFSPLRVLDPAAQIPSAMFGGIPFVIALVAVPVGAAIAILRYRLYDIDLLINRTVVYGATSAAIAALFFLGILALTQVLRPLTSGSELAVAASTLGSFALFQPIRRRVQDAVDRRFDRSRYDAARTLDAFADQLRDEVDLDTLRADLIGAVRQTMAPAHSSLWLRERPR